MDGALEKECNALGGLFQSVINEMKSSYPHWEDVAQKAVKLSVQLRSTIVALDQFLDALQKISDYATNTKGATRDIGTALTRICMRHRSMENRLKTVSSSLIDCLVLPLQEHADDWLKRTNNLDKEHAREYKKTKNEIRKRSTDTIRLQKKVKKGENRMQPMLESAVQEMNDRYSNLLDNERRMCRAALTEQRSQFCYFVSWFKPVLDLELGLLEEASHLREVTDLLCKHSAEPNTLPPASEAVICDAKGLEHTWTQQFVSPPSSPSSLGSRKSSFCSLSSGDNQSLHYAQRVPLNQNSHYRTPQQQAYRGTNQTTTTNGRFTASHDSGIANSQDVIYAPASQHSSGSFDRQPLASTPGGLSQQSTPSPSPSAVTWPEHSVGGSPVHHDAAIPGLNLSARQSPRHYSQSNGSPNATPRPHTISAAEGGGRQAQRQRPSLGAAVFVPPQSPPNRPATLGIQRTSAAIYKENNGKPPLPGKRQSSATPSLTPTPTMGGPRMSVPIIPDFNAIQPDQFVPQAIYANMDMANPHRRQRSGSSDAAAAGGRRQRPLSFVGDNEDMHRLLQAAGMALGGGQSGPYRDRSSFISDRGGASNSGSSATMSGRDEDEGDMNGLDTLIEEALGQIDRLTTDLDSYCHIASDKSPSTPAYCTLPRQRSADGGIVRWRPPIGRSFDPPADFGPVNTFSTPHGRGAGVPSAATSMSSVASTGDRRSSKVPPPPPPVRRNSTITAATPTAPSVEFVRSSRCTTPVEDGGYSSATMYSLNTRLKMAADRPPDAGVNEHNYQVLQQQQSNPNGGHFQRHSQQKSSPPQYQIPYMQQQQQQQYPSSSVVRGASEPPSDQFSVAHETLLLQIRNGVHLRRPAYSNDRSMPHV